DLLNWKPVGEVAEGNSHYWDELIGAGPPPVKTDNGWLLVYHGIALHYQPIYQAGVMLLDLDDPTKVIARGKYNILEPQEMDEMVGQVPNVVFPSGMIVEDQRVMIYYGAADTCVCMAETTIEELIDACFA
ncbi:MAG: glycosidase, partial [bacterium]|nr:glycosidase [bacterium]